MTDSNGGKKKKKQMIKGNIVFKPCKFNLSSPQVKEAQNVGSRNSDGAIRDATYIYQS